MCSSPNWSSRGRYVVVGWTNILFGYEADVVLALRRLDAESGIYDAVFKASLLVSSSFLVLKVVS